jgi:ComF family protein
MNVPRRAPAWEAFRRLGCRWLPPIVQAATDLLLPPACNFCGRSLARPSSQPLICAECREAFIAKIGPSCPRCAAPVHPFEAGPDCPRCRKRRYAFHSTLALGIYRDRLREAVIRMKQRLHEPLTISMGHLLAETMAEAVQQERPDLLIAVPTFWMKRLRRGVNGPDLLAEAIGSTLSIRTVRRLLYCRRSTKKQGTLLPFERLRNVRNAFGVNKSYDLAEARVMLVDDIMTTGATASEAARTLRRAGASRVTVLVVARGVGQDQRGAQR